MPQPTNPIRMLGKNVALNVDLHVVYMYLMCLAVGVPLLLVKLPIVGALALLAPQGRIYTQLQWDYPALGLRGDRIYYFIANESFALIAIAGYAILWWKRIS